MKNAISNKITNLNDEYELFNLDELEDKLQGELEEEVSNLELLKEERERIGNPDALGKVIFDEVWKQFSNQIGLEVTNETLNQRYDREHPLETYADVGEKVMQDSGYRDANKAMKEKQKAGNLKDEYTGKNIGPNEKANLDHVVSRKELHENARRRQAGIKTEELANMSENLKATNESLNKSKGAKSIGEYCNKREQREKDLIEQNKRANEKIDKSNRSDIDKKRAKEENNKRLQDKLDADDELMKKADSDARKAINMKIAKGVAKATVKKAGKDALKQMAVSAIFALLKETMNGLVRFFKTKAKSFRCFMDEMELALKSFCKKITGILKEGVNSFVGTVSVEIFGPIVSTYKKLASFIKQGISSVMDAVRYLKDEDNKNKPLGIKVAQIGKIAITGLSATGALALGETIEKGLLSVAPVLNIQIPLLGSLANIIGIFLASLLNGVAGAMVINFIDKFIARQQRADASSAVLKTGNKIIAQQHKLQIVNGAILEKDRENVQNNIVSRHQEAASIAKNAYGKIMDDFVKDFSRDKNTTINEQSISVFNEIDSASYELDNLLK